MDSVNAAVRVIEPGLLTTVQDLGRRGFQKYGVPVCGALDAVSLRIANVLVGNRESAAGLEMTAIGPKLRFERESVIAVAGADFTPLIDGRAARAWESARVPAGATLSFAPPNDGLRACLAIAGGIAVPPLMNSRATDLKGGFGGHEGRALRGGDVLPVGFSPHLDAAPKRLPEAISRQPTYSQSFQIRVVLGPQLDRFTETGIAVMLTSEYTVSIDSDRTGCRLEGPAIEHVSGADVVSDGSALGSVQVPGSGTPIVLLSDRGTTGGYTKAATVISPDIGLLAQAMPGAKARFAAVSVEEAREALIEQERMMGEIKSFVGLDLSGAVSLSVDGADTRVTDADGGAITAAPALRTARRAARRVSATLEGERFDFEVEVGIA